MIVVNNNIKNFNAGDSINFFIELQSDYLNTDYTCKLILINSSNKIQNDFISDDQDFNKFDLILSSASTSNFIYGNYDVYVKITKNDNTFSNTQQIKTIKINENLLNATAQIDLTHAQKTLKILEDLIENKISASDIQSYSIAGRSISKMNFSEILKWRDYYKKEVLAQQSIKKYGKNVENKIRIDYVGKNWK